MRGQTKHGVRREGSRKLAGGEDGGVKRLGGLVVGDDDEAGRIGCANEEGKIERARSCREARHTSAPRTSAQVAAYTLKCFRVLKIRKKLADEG